MSNVVDEAVNAYVPPLVGERPDWPDVVARAQALPVEQRREQVRRSIVRSRRVLVVAVAALLLVAIAVATPASGIRHAISSLLDREDVPFSQATSAPTVKKQEFNEMLAVGAPPGMDPHIILDEVKLAGTFDLRGINRRVWVAPTEDGGFCFTIEHGAGGCQPTPQRVRDRIDPVGMFVARPGEAVAMERVDGVVFDPSATTLRLRFEDGRVLPLRFVYVSKPIDAGFFLYKTSAEEQERGHRPLAVELLNAEGAIVAREDIDYANEERKREEIEKLHPPLYQPDQQNHRKK
jgi:hypothetical protein